MRGYLDGWGLDKPAEHTGRRQFVGELVGIVCEEVVKTGFRVKNLVLFLGFGNICRGDAGGCDGICWNGTKCNTLIVKRLSGIIFVGISGAVFVVV